ncbi:MAG: YdcF family protein [Rectinemataceae bacterium]|nr:YdcF family protein [Rectinemataceae bacterium]
MFLLKKLITTLLLPPVGPLLLVIFGIILSTRRPRLGKALAAFGIVLLLLLSTPWVAHRLLRGIEPARAVEPIALAEAQAIVILGGGSTPDAPEYGGTTVSRYTLERLRYGARLARQTGLPILVTGGAPFGGRPEAESMREVMEQDFSLNVRWIEAASRDTAENAAFSVPLLHQGNIHRMALVTHASHMPRSQRLFEKQGMTVIPAPTGFTRDSPSSIEMWMPSTGALNKSRSALHEWLGGIVARFK